MTSQYNACEEQKRSDVITKNSHKKTLLLHTTTKHSHNITTPHLIAVLLRFDRVDSTT